MKIIKENSLFYLHSRATTMIIEEQAGYLFLRYIGRKVTQYHHANAVVLKDIAFTGKPGPRLRAFSLPRKNS